MTRVAEEIKQRKEFESTLKSKISKEIKEFKNSHQEILMRLRGGAKFKPQLISTSNNSTGMDKNR